MDFDVTSFLAGLLVGGLAAAVATFYLLDHLDSRPVKPPKDGPKP